ncbi:GspH/FimT family pseudopilin [Hydrogenophaga sp. ANAO-22]|jgi:type IV fimbrial biogenesis protein FimT|uniref:GspH/FimT family pseudopilin n=1 Tax=Hydrogenophaga sp. ANAO-22 TaxID=3166645 RepID=UPI0036D405BE
MYIAAAPQRATPAPLRAEGGFTIIELMVVVALIAILAGLAAPSFTDMFRRFRVDSVRETFTSSVTLAREEAIRLGTPVVIRRITGCGLALANNQDWSCGWQVFADLDGNNAMNGAETPTQEVSLTPNVTVRKGNNTNPEFIVINRFGQVTQVDQRFEVFPTGMAAANGQLICFTAGTRLRTVKNASACP